MNHVDEIYQGSKTVKAFAEGYIKYLSSVLAAIDTSAIQKFTEAILKARDQGKQIFFIGNGGSAATASHFANDFSIGTRCPWKPFKAIALTDNNAIMTAIGNDFGYDMLFVKQLEVLLQPGDLVVAISASGNSPNLLKAVEFAKSRGNICIGLTGFDGGKLKEMSDLFVHVQTPKGEYAPVEDAHMVLDHLIGSYLNRIVAAEKQG
jgi:D-sedoheptulose 7-phosphate isomerase